MTVPGRFRSISVQLSFCNSDHLRADGAGRDWPPTARPEASRATKKFSLPESFEIARKLFGWIAAERLGCGSQTLGALASTGWMRKDSRRRCFEGDGRPRNDPVDDETASTTADCQALKIRECLG